MVKDTDKILVGIVAGVVLLIVVAFVVVLTRPDPEYQSDETPQGVVHNYLLALQKGEYERALSYISSSIDRRPEDSVEFAEDAHDNWSFRTLDRDTSIIIDSTQITGKRASVEVRETVYRDGGIFDNWQDESSFEMILLEGNGEWKLIHGDMYWAPCWDWEKGCP